MAYIVARKHPARALPSRLTRTTAALALMASPAAFAQTASTEPASTLPPVKVKAAVENEYKADRSSSPKFTQPLVDTPQTVTVIKKEILRQQGSRTLSEALGNTPGITFQMGENGNTQTGDAIFMRGFDTQQSIFVDGIRDIGTVSRDVFNLEQIEIVKGPAGADIGRGSPTGYVNLATKVPTLETTSSGSVTVGSGNLRRFTVDANAAVPTLGDGTAVRLNLMKEDSQSLRRDHVENGSWAFAPSIALGLNTPTRTYLYYLHVEQDNRPDGGMTSFGEPGYVFNAEQQEALTAAGVTSVAMPSRSNFYGSLSDFNRVKADMFTARIEHDLKPGVTLRNISRFGRTEQQYVLTGINAVNVGNRVRNRDGTFTPPPAGVSAADPSTWIIGLSRQGKDQENLILTNQTNLNAEFTTGGLSHSLSTGVEFMHEKQTNVTQAVIGSAGVANLYAPNPYATFAPVGPNGQRASGSTTTAALYAFDTLKLSDAFHVVGGLRFEKYKTTSDNIVAGTAPNTLAPVSLSNTDDLVTWKLGALWKPASNGSVYVAYATSQKPPGSDSFALSSTVDNANNPNLDPSKATNLELGTKWELLDKQLALTAAIYRAIAENDVVESDPVTKQPLQMGKKTVKGIELGAAGMLTPAWQVNAGLGLMDTEINATRRADAAQEGNALPWSPRLSFTSWTTYKLPMGVTLGGGARYTRSTNRNSNTTNDYLSQVPSYWVYDAMAAWEVTRNVSLQLNVYNLADKFYIKSLNNGGSRYTVGAPRSASLTANVTF
jgi:catecholate siderophore receptor